MALEELSNACERSPGIRNSNWTSRRERGRDFIGLAEACKKPRGNARKLARMPCQSTTMMLTNTATPGQPFAPGNISVGQRNPKARHEAHPRVNASSRFKPHR